MKAYISQSGRQSYSYCNTLLSLLIIIEGWQTGLWGMVEEAPDWREGGGEGGGGVLLRRCLSSVTVHFEWLLPATSDLLALGVTRLGESLLGQNLHRSSMASSHPILWLIAEKCFGHFLPVRRFLQWDTDRIFHQTDWHRRKQTHKHTPSHSDVMRCERDSIAINTMSRNQRWGE